MLGVVINHVGKAELLPLVVYKNVLGVELEEKIVKGRYFIRILISQAFLVLLDEEHQW